MVDHGIFTLIVLARKDRNGRHLALERPIPKDRINSFREAVSQFLRCLPDNVRVLACVRMDLLQLIFSASKYHGNIESMSKDGFVVDAAALTSLSLREVRD